MEQEAWSWAALAGGAFAVVAAVMDWDWFMDLRNVEFFVAVLGRDGARLLYVLLGVGIAGFGGSRLMGRGH